MGKGRAVGKALRGLVGRMIPIGTVRVVARPSVVKPPALPPPPVRPSLRSGSSIRRRAIPLESPRRLTLRARLVATPKGVIIDTSRIGRRVSLQAQARHVRGDRRYRGGGYFLDRMEAQRVLDRMHDGTGQILGVKGDDVVVRVDDVEAFNDNRATGHRRQPTNVFFVKGSTKVSVVPMSPQWVPRAIS